VQSGPPARTASAEGGGSVTSAPIPGDAATAGSAMPQPADHGVGPVSPSISPSTPPSSSTAGGSARRGTNGGAGAFPPPSRRIEKGSGGKFGRDFRGGFRTPPKRRKKPET